MAVPDKKTHLMLAKQQPIQLTLKGINMSFVNSRGIFLQLLAPSIVSPNEAVVSMKLGLEVLGYNEETEEQTHTLVDITELAAFSNDGGKTFTLRTVRDIDGDGDIDEADKEKLLALASAYARILNP